jgi:pimeloyl-ACP methyl ester carboxylesterase
MSDTTFPLVFIHAFPMGPRMWRTQLDAIAARPVVAPPLPGFDGRARQPEPTVDGYARDLLAVLDGARIDKATFCGLSLGGYVLFGILRQAPERVAGLILADTRTSLDTPERLAARARSIETVRQRGPAAIADEMIPNLISPMTQATQPGVAAELRQLIESQSVDAIADGLQAMITRPDSAAVLTTVRVPTLIIVGSEDTITPVTDAESMHRAISGSRLVTIPGVGHMANMEAPGEFNTALLEFLESAKFEVRSSQ